MPVEPAYLGDAVYVRDDRGDVILTTESHLEAEAGNVIVLEAGTLARLLDWLKKRDREEDGCG